MAPLCHYEALNIIAPSALSEAKISRFVLRASFDIAHLCVTVCKNHRKPTTQGLVKKNILKKSLSVA